MKKNKKYMICVLSAFFIINICTAQDTTEVVTAWLKQNSITIEYIEPGNTYSDLQPLKEHLQNVQVIGLGEATHGTQEFFKMKHRMIEFLITQMGFTAFALESSYSNCEPINDYILTGKGDRAEVLTNQGYTPWDTEEFSSMLDWLRDYNLKVPDEKKVRFYGIDVLSFQGVGREKVLAYVQKYAPEKAIAVDSLFTVLESEDNKWARGQDQDILQSAFIPLQDLMSYFTTNKSKLIASSSLEEWEHAYKFLEVMEQGLYVNTKDVPTALVPKKLSRDEFMAKNLFYLIEKERPGTKFMVWQHDWHISNRPEQKTLGNQLRQKLGDKYYALAFMCYQGTFQTRVMLPEGGWGELKADTLLPVQKSLEWYLYQTGKKKLFLNLRNLNSDPIVDKWLDTPIRFHAGSWMYRGADENFDTRKIKDLYDGIIFIENSTPVHPTKNAQLKSANKIGF